MKSIFLIGALLAVPLACTKELDQTEDLFPLEPASLDETAAGWDMIVLSGPAQIAVAAPSDPASDAYKSELAAIKSAQSQLTGKQREMVEYWSAGGVLRWNEFARQLVARYNLAPAPKADGTYPVPNADNPFGDPKFPFANPPYAARAYSYVSVGQYEALKSAWYYKYLYNRAAPYTIDNEVQALVPETSLPAYPSEDAVLSGVTADILKALFPASVEEITLKAADQRNAALWSGKAAASDISAGLALGKAVAAAMLARAASDGMSAAGGSPALWKALEDNAIANGQIPWISQENPKRPPMLPLFGQVRGWNMSPADIVNERPPAPPSTSSPEMAAELAEVKSYSGNDSRDLLRVVHKWADGAGTYTPPGHWNDIAAEYVRDARFSEVRAARAFALLNMALHDAAVACWEVKYYYFNPRPSQLDPSIKTSTGLPNFPAYTSGHSTFSAAAAVVLSYLFPEASDYFITEAEQAAVSRLYGCIHFRSDVEAGNTHGATVGSYTVAYALTDGAD
jgi:hypothetical protein